MRKEEKFLADLYCDYHDLMQSFAMDIVQDKNIAEDMVQEAFIRLMPHVKKLRKMKKAVCIAYLRSTVRRTSLNYAAGKEPRRLRDALLQEEDPVKMEEIADRDADTEREVLKKITAEEMKDCIRQLPPAYQDTLNFKYLLELSDAEIGGCLGISKDSVRQYLTRARRKALEIYRRTEGDAGDEKRQKIFPGRR